MPAIPPSFTELLTEKSETGVTVSLSRRLRHGWRVAVRSGTHHLVVPQYLAGAPREIKEALIEWARMAGGRYRGRYQKEHRRRKRELQSLVWRYIYENHAEELAGRCVAPEAFSGSTRGVRYDLTEVRDTVNRTMLGGRVQTCVRWGSRGSLMSYQCMRRAPDGSRYSLITIAGAYNHPDVPRFAIEGVMYHEMLHVLIPPERTGNRRIVHGPLFRARERVYPYYEQWRRWERSNLRRLSRLLRSAHVAYEAVR